MFTRIIKLSAVLVALMLAGLVQAAEPVSKSKLTSVAIDGNWEVYKV